MNKIEQFFQLYSTWNFFWVLVAAMIATAFFGAATDIWRKPTGLKTGFMCFIAFIFGAIAIFIAK